MSQLRHYAPGECSLKGKANRPFPHVSSFPSNGLDLDTAPGSRAQVIAWHLLFAIELPALLRVAWLDLVQVSDNPEKIALLHLRDTSESELR